MSSCSVQQEGTLSEDHFTRTCPSCRLKISNQFLTSCPRCAAKLSLAELCTGCFQNGACHTEMTPKNTSSFFSLSDLLKKVSPAPRT